MHRTALRLSPTWLARTVLCLAAGASAGAHAQGSTATGTTPAAAGQGWSFGAVLDIGYTSRPLALGLRDKGLQLGHSDITASGPLGPYLRAAIGAAFATHEGEFEREIEEAYLETTALPAGLQLRAGRFASQVGYLNEQHLHADDFTERPLLYRAFFGGHWFDDGVRLNWTAPTPFYLMLGAEAFGGKQLVAENAGSNRWPGVATLVAKTGADFGRNSSWQLGLSLMKSRREALVEEHAEGEEEHHEHGAHFSGRRTVMLDATWKWAPNGNNREKQLRLNLETARISGINRFSQAGETHTAHAITAVWRFNPSWEAGIRADWLRAQEPHEEGFEPARLQERSVMVAWKPSHLQTLRLQLTQQRKAVGFDDAAKRSVQLQYVISFGAHGAHAY